MSVSRAFIRLLALVSCLVLGSCGLPTMKSEDFAVADAAARSTGKWTRADDGTAARPRYRAGNPDRLAQVTYMTASPKSADFESFVSSYGWTVERSGGKEIGSKTWRHRGHEVKEILYDFGPGFKNQERYVQVLFSKTPAKIVVVRTLARTLNPSAVKGNDLMKAVLDAGAGI